MATEPITGRNFDQIVEDELIQVHTQLNKEIRGTVPRLSTLQGEQRLRALEVLKMLDRCIEAGDFTEVLARFQKRPNFGPRMFIINYIFRQR